LTASAGGHLSQLLKLENAWQAHDVFYVSTLESACNKLDSLGRYYITGECNREHPLRVIRVLGQCISIIHVERPDVIITTGAAPACLLCLVGKLFGAKIIWLDSIANVERLSLSGRLVRLFADLFLTQWPHLTTMYCNIEYVGAVV
jgi:UDP-N-acetylglucosamine:LPS N-acetylglucosamine transferase